MESRLLRTVPAYGRDAGSSALSAARQRQQKELELCAETAAVRFRQRGHTSVIMLGVAPALPGGWYSLAAARSRRRTPGLSRGPGHRFEPRPRSHRLSAVTVPAQLSCVVPSQRHSSCVTWPRQPSPAVKDACVLYSWAVQGRNDDKPLDDAACRGTARRRSESTRASRPLLAPVPCTAPPPPQAARPTLDSESRHRAFRARTQPTRPH